MMIPPDMKGRSFLNLEMGNNIFKDTETKKRRLKLKEPPEPKFAF